MFLPHPFLIYSRQKTVLKMFQFKPNARLVHEEVRRFYIADFTIHENVNAEALHDKLFSNGEYMGYSFQGVVHSFVSARADIKNDLRAGAFFIVWNYSDDQFMRMVVSDINRENPPAWTPARLHSKYEVVADPFGDRLRGIRLDDLYDIVDGKFSEEEARAMVGANSTESISSYVTNIKDRLLRDSGMSAMKV